MARGGGEGAERFAYVCCVSIMGISVMGSYPLWGLFANFLADQVADDGDGTYGIGFLLTLLIVAGVGCFIGTLASLWVWAEENLGENAKASVQVCGTVTFGLAVVGSYPLWGLAVPGICRAIGGNYLGGFLIMWLMLCTLGCMLGTCTYIFDDLKRITPESAQKCCAYWLYGSFMLAIMGSYPLWGIVPGAIRDSTIDEISDGNGGTIETQPTMNFGGGFAITACIVLGFTGVISCCIVSKEVFDDFINRPRGGDANVFGNNNTTTSTISRPTNAASNAAAFAARTPSANATATATATTGGASSTQRSSRFMLNAMEAIRSSSSSQSYGASSSSHSSAPPAYETIYMGGARGSGSGSGSGLPAYNGSAFAGGPIVL